MLDSRLINTEPLPYVLSIICILSVNPTCTYNYDPKRDLHVLKKLICLFLSVLVRSVMLKVSTAYYDGWFFYKEIELDLLIWILLLCDDLKKLMISTTACLLHVSWDCLFSTASIQREG